jgi:hypothetical protein
MIYFSNVPVRPDSIDDEQRKAVREFRSECQKRGIIETYDTIEEFREKLGRQLAQKVLRIVARLAPISQDQEVAPLLYKAISDAVDGKIQVKACNSDGTVTGEALTLNVLP